MARPAYVTAFVFLLSILLVGFAKGQQFSSQFVISTNADSASTVHAADLDGDGDKDVLSGSSDVVAWHENFGFGEIGSQTVIDSTEESFDSVNAADLDGDGDIDVIGTLLNAVVWYENTGEGAFSERKVIDSNGGDGIFLTDVDRDGDQDLLITDLARDEVGWYENAGGGSFSSRLVIDDSAQRGNSVHAADLDGDEDQDIVAAALGSGESDDNVLWYENFGDGSFSARKVITADANGARSIYVADLNGDNEKDVVYVAGFSTYETTWHENTGGGSFGGKNTISTAPDVNTVHVADLTGDGDNDILTASGNKFSDASDEKISWYENAGGGAFSEEKVITTETDRASSVYAADLDGDTGVDVLSASFDDDTIAWYQNQGADETAPSSPTGLAATAGDQRVELNWDANTESDLAGYHVYRSTSSFQETASATQVSDGLVTEAGYIDTGLTNGTEYFYRVAAVDDAGNESGLSGESSAIPEDQPPSAPTGLTATAGDGAVTLGWDANVEEDLGGYNVYRSTSSFQEVSSATRLNDAAVESEGFIDTGVSNGTEYFYRVTAVDTSGNESGGSNEASATPTGQTAPSAPAGLTASGGDSEVSLGWEPNSENDLDGYRVYRSTSSFAELVNATQVNSSLLQDASYTDTGVSNGQEYFYRVTAVDTSGTESDPSSEASATPTNQAPPAAPTGLQATGVDSQVALGWDANDESDVEGYNVYRSTSSFAEVANATKVNPALVGGSAYGDTTVTNDTEYFYRVTAVDSSGNGSGGSNEDSAIPRPPPVAETGEATDVTGTSAILHGQVDPNGNETIVVFEYFPTGQSEDPLGAFARESPLTGTDAQSVSAPISGLAPDTEYTFRVSAGNQSGGDSGGTRTFTTTASVPSAPTGLQASGGNGEVSLGWEANPEGDLAGYNVYRSTSSFQEVASATQVNDGLIGESSYTDSGLTNGTEYFYRVTAVDTSENESGGSNQAIATPTNQSAPAAPTGLQATGIDSQVGLSWDANTESDLAGYNVYRSTSSFAEVANATKVNPVLVEGSASGDTTVTNNTEYFYRVTAVDSSGNESGVSNEDSATPKPPPIAETNEATDVTGTSAVLHGQVDPNGNETIVVFEYFPTGQSDDPLGALARESPLTGTDAQSVSAPISGLAPDTEYTFRVSAGNQSGGDSGDTRTFTTTASVPSAPTGLQASGGNGEVSLGWDANAEEDLAGYNVYRSTSSFQEVSNATQVNDGLVGEASYTDRGLTNGTEYFYRVTAVDTSENESGGSNETSATPFLEVTLTRSVETPELGTPLEISVSVSEGFEPADVQLFYREGGASEFQSLTLEGVGGATYEGTVPGDAVTERGLEYYAQVSDGSVTATVPEQNPAENPRHVPVQVPQRMADIELAEKEYTMVSVPLAVSANALEVLRDDFGEVDRTEWRLLRWDAGDEEYVEVTQEEGSRETEFGRGEAYWLISRQGGTFDVEDAQSASEGPVSITLPSGWTQFANPYPYPVAWSDIDGTESVNAPVAFDPESPDSLQFGVSVLKAWTGYWVFNPNDSSVPLTVPPKEATSAGQGSVAATTSSTSTSSGGPLLFDSEPSYAVRVTGTLKRDEERALRDLYTVAGVGDGGQPGVGVEDVAEPPPIGDHLRISILEEGTRLAGSLRSPGKDGYTWDLEVTASEGERGRVRGEIESRGVLPPGFEYRLVDRETGRQIPVEGGVFTVGLTDEQPTRRLRLIVGSEAFAGAQSEAIEPERTGLRAVYPNPSKGAVSIDYHLKAAQQVRIGVYDLLGRRVRTLVDGRRPAGHHTARWDGRSRSGPLSSGAYFVRMRAESTTANRRVVLVR